MNAKGVLNSHLLDAPSAGLDHRGDPTADLVMRSCEAVKLPLPQLKKRLASVGPNLTLYLAHSCYAKLLITELMCVCMFEASRATVNLTRLGADGAGASGGPLARHSSTGTAEKIWRRVRVFAFHSRPLSECSVSFLWVMGPHTFTCEVHPNCRAGCEMAVWDRWHRLNVAVSRAIDSSPLALELFDVSKSLDSLFSVGLGRVIFRSVAAEVGSSSSRYQGGGGTRKASQLSSVSTGFLKGFRVVSASLVARVSAAQEGRGAESQDELHAIRRRVASPDLIAFACAVSDVSERVIEPVAHVVQRESEEPWSMDASIHNLRTGLLRAQLVFKKLRRWLLVCPPVAGSRELMCFLVRCWLASFAYCTESSSLALHTVGDMLGRALHAPR